MEKAVVIKENKDRYGFVLPIEFRGDFSDDEKIKILQSYFQNMVFALLENKTEEEFIRGIMSIWQSDGYIARRYLSKTFDYSWNILGPMSEMMMDSASKLLKENPDWPPNLAASIIFCVNAMEMVINNKLMNRFNEINRHDKAKLVEDDRSLSLEDKFTWLLNDAFNSSLKSDDTLWMWFLDIKNMRNKIIHLKKSSDGTDITLNDKAGNPRKKLDKLFCKEAIQYTQKGLDYLKAL